MQFKQCSRCGEIKSVDSFHYGHGKYYSRCKACNQELNDLTQKQLKQCPHCREVKSQSDFWIFKNGKHAGRPYGYCKSCAMKLNNARRKVRRQNLIYREKEDKKWRQKERELRLKARQEILEFFSHECEICGENLVEFLTIDHIASNGTGYAARKRGEHGGWRPIWRECRKAGWSEILYDKYRILCFNCNCATGLRTNPFLDWRVSLGASKISELFSV